MGSYKATIGLEIHAQISTKTKMFCFCDNDSFQKEPNINTCPICMGYPGQLPMINEEAVNKGIKVALALNLNIQKFSKFDRKNYFYPDLPKGFQISQFDQPLAQNGYVEIVVNGDVKKVRINRLHLEDDAGKLTHVRDGTLCDYNRSGTPLMEIVTEPDLSTPEEASLYAKEIQKILRYVEASECDMEKGMMRFDINISIRPEGQEKLGTRTEVKNLNSFRALEKALEYEIERQTGVLDKGEKVNQETRGWDTNKEITVSQRSKEESHDYRYFPEPDLPPVTLSDEDLKELKENLPELPKDKYNRFLDEYKVGEDDARILTDDIYKANFFKEVVKVSDDPQKAVSFINTILLKKLKEDQIGIQDCKITGKRMGELIKMINDGEISGNMAKSEIFDEMYISGKDPKKIVEEKGLKQVSDESELEKICQEVIDENPGQIEQFKGGKENIFGFFVGQAMKKTKGQGNPQKINEILRKKLK